MIRLLARLLFWPLLLGVFVLLLLPLTNPGSRWLLERLQGFVPLQLEYADGNLAGELRLARLGWQDEDISLELLDVVLELDLRCLWRSAFCLQQLQARQLDIAVLPGADNGGDAEQSAGGEGGLLVFPFALEVPDLYLGGLRVGWDGGEWRQGLMEGAVSIQGSLVHVSRAVVQGAGLVLDGSDTDDQPLQLPELDLPLELQVDDLLLRDAGWDVHAEQGSLQSLQVRGGWRNTLLRLDALQLHASKFGEAVAAGSMEFTGGWPLQVGIDAFPAASMQWSPASDRHLRLDASGDLGNLAMQAVVTGEVTVAARLQLDALAADLPFQLDAEATWGGELRPAEYVDLPGQLAALALRAPFSLSASGSLAQQQYQLDAAGGLPGYPELTLHLGARHQAGLLEVDDLKLVDSSSSSSLSGSGALHYGERWEGSLHLESEEGVDLGLFGDAVDGRLGGHLQLAGWLAGDAWELALSDVSLQGTVNGLPASMTGHGGITGDGVLLPSAFDARCNGAHLVLQRPPGEHGEGRLQLQVAELGRWVPDSHGSLDLQVVVDDGWQQFDLQGSLEALSWGGAGVDAGRLQGFYRPAQETFQVQLALQRVGLGALELDQVTLAGRGSAGRQVLSLASSGDVTGRLEVAGAIAGNGGWRGELDATSLQTAEGTWHLDEPVALQLGTEPARLQVAAHCWHYQQSRICPGEALLGATGEASLELFGGLDVLSVLLPEYLEASGTLDANVATRWAPGVALELQGSLQGRDLLVTRHFGGGESGSVRWQSLDAEVTRSARGLELEADLVARDRRVIELSLLLPEQREGPLAGMIDLRGLQLGNLAPFFPGLSSLEGDISGQLDIGGTLDAPRTRGELQLSGGQLALLGYPTELQDLDLTLQALGDRFALQGAGLLGGGELRISGTVESSPQWQLELGMSGERQELLIPPYTQMLVSEDLQLRLSAAELDLGGRVIVHEGVLEHEQLPEGSVALSRDVVEVDMRGDVINQSSDLPTRIDVALLMEDRFKIVGDMVNATLGGDLQLLQTPGKPLQLFGNLNVIGGELRAFQQRLRIQRGTVSFSGPPENPELDISAQREVPADKVVVGISLRGSLQQPQLQVFSDPVMSQANTMSYLIRGRPVDTGAEADGIATALTLGTGLVNETPLVTQLNEIPGISNLAFGAEGSEEDTAATVGGYIGERLYLSYGMGIYEPINVLTARLYLQTRLWLEVVSRLENSVDLYYSFDID
ncbi:MAG: translocation/assembly module TamB domain-containing protein [Halieaceae bacterium]|nr:translocation/assembly module TamB domain-containing protein [Halieaceae bacterium]